MTLPTLAQVRKVAGDPRLALSLINAQLQAGWRARVPISVRLRGRISISGRGTVVLGERVMLVGTIVPIEMIALDGGRIEIGERSFINYGTCLSAHQQISIGHRCKIGHYVHMMDNAQHDIVDRTRTPQSYPIILEDDVWIGARSIILPGVRIGRRSIVGAGSVVTRDVAPDTIVAGNPAQLVRELRVET